MSAQDSLGNIINEHEKRDAIHIAIAPVIAVGKIYAGERLALVDGDPTRAFRCDDQRTVGVADPFLIAPVRDGERFWLFLLPNTITGLRHEWTHPAFDGPVPKAEKLTPKEVSERWLRDWCDRNDVPGYEEVVALAVQGDVIGGGYLLVRGSDAHATIPPEFWDHIEVVTGKNMKPEDRAESFSCSC